MIMFKKKHYIIFFVVIIIFTVILLSDSNFDEKIPISIDSNTPFVSVQMQLQSPFTGNLGGVMKLTSIDKNVECHAGFINTMHTRLEANRNSLEFWCDGIDEHGWYDIGKPEENKAASEIINFDGKLYERHSKKVYNFNHKKWDDAFYPDWFNRRHGSLFSIQKRVNGTYFFNYSSKNCNGVSIYNDDQYWGTIRDEGKGNISAVYAYEDKVYANLDGKIILVQLPQNSIDEVCYDLDTIVLSDSTDYWLYGFFEYESKLYAGSSNAEGCVNLFRIQKQKVEPLDVFINGEYCQAGEVTEIYSYIVRNNELLLGTYPSGNLLRVQKDAAYLELDLPGYSKDDYISPDGQFYRESQSMTIAKGRLYIGMYPYGEVYEIYDNKKKIIRLFEGPPKNTKERAPYYSKILNFANNVDFLSVEHVKKDLYRVYSNDNDYDPRRHSLEPTSWGQRITSLAVLNGKICAATANLSGYPLKEDINLPFLPKNIREKYGNIWCKNLENHVLAEPEISSSMEFSFVITDSAIAIMQNNEVIKAIRHNLNNEALRSLKNGFNIELEHNLYGKFPGKIKRI